MKQLRTNILLIIAVVLFGAQSCASIQLKPYERVYVNDSEMQMGADNGENFQNYAYSIREGATPTGSAKGSGGCGCN